MCACYFGCDVQTVELVFQKRQIFIGEPKNEEFLRQLFLCEVSKPRRGSTLFMALRSACDVMAKCHLKSMMEWRFCTKHYYLVVVITKNDWQLVNDEINMQRREGILIPSMGIFNL